MNTQLRHSFNQQFSKDKYQSLLEDITNKYPEQLDFRVAESPVFVDRAFKDKLISASEHIAEVIARPDFKKRTEKAIPNGFHFENEGDFPQVMCVDFAIVKGSSGELEPQLIELQGFPSLFAYQNLLFEQITKYYDIPSHFSPFFNVNTSEGYLSEMQSFFVKPGKRTVLLEIYPWKQKTRIDFTLTKTFWDVESICLTEIEQENGKPYYVKNGEKLYIDRIYNRIIFDELETSYPQLLNKAKSLTNLEVEWISNPNWFYRVSKYCMPMLQHEYIPYSKVLSEIESIPEDLENYVLKPLFSFAGGGVVIDLDRKTIDEIDHPENYILQRKVNYEPFIINPDGNKIKAEIRLMFIWKDGQNRPTLITNLARLSQGKMIGVDYNKNKDWVGGSISFFES